MARRSLVACLALVLLAHGGAIMAVGASQASPRAGAARAPARGVFSLVRMTSPDAPAPTATQPPARAEAAKTREAEAQAPASNAGAGRPPSADAAGELVYRRGADLDVPARPRSTPDLAMLSGLPWSGLPLRVRLFIDSDGLVVDTQVLQSAEPPEVVERVRQMFLATSFTAGVANGRPVPCFKDIELNVGANS